MKKYLLLLVVIGIVISCDEGTENVDPDSAVYKLVYTQSGDLDSFTKNFTFSSLGGDNDHWKILPSGDILTTGQTGLLNDDLTNSTYTVETANKVKEISIGISFVQVPFEDESSEMNVLLEVFKDGVLIDTHNINMVYSEISKVWSEDYSATN